MDRRDFLNTVGAAAVTAILPAPAFARSGYDRLLILVELKSKPAAAK